MQGYTYRPGTRLPPTRPYYHHSHRSSPIMLLVRRRYRPRPSAAFPPFTPRAPFDTVPAAAAASRPKPQCYRGRALLKLRLMRPYTARPVLSGGGGGCAPPARAAATRSGSDVENRPRECIGHPPRPRSSSNHTIPAMRGSTERRRTEAKTALGLAGGDDHEGWSAAGAGGRALYPQRDSPPYSPPRTDTVKARKPRRDSYDRAGEGGRAASLDAPTTIGAADGSPIRTHATRYTGSLAEVKITETEMNALVELGFQEAALICTQLLHIHAPKLTPAKPVKLTPLGVPAGRTNATSGDDSDDSDLDFVEDAARDAARYSALCDDYEAVVKEAESILQPVGPLPPLPTPPTPRPASQPPIIHQQPLKSEIIGADGKLSIEMMLQARRHWQSGTTTRSEKVVRIDSKYALSRIARAKSTQHDDDTEPEKMTLQEASNAVRVLQDLNSATHTNKPRKYREIRWMELSTTIQKLVDSSILPNISAKNVHALNPLTVGSYTIMWNGARFYVGQMDVYKRVAKSRYGSVKTSATVSGLVYMSMRVYLSLTTDSSTAANNDEGSASEPEDEPMEPGDSTVRLYTHAKIEHLLFNLGSNAFDKVQNGRYWALTPHAAAKRTALTTPRPVRKAIKKLTLKLGKPPKTVA
ncbi:hypothetical protein C8R47DRAFT_1298326 [Mycena vitilis]|nr:hypothetical protein C8R47DRAFT_1298326 [Mycena vitilis]